jgi:hypothetical protein
MTIEQLLSELHDGTVRAQVTVPTKPARHARHHRATKASRKPK